MEYDPVLYTISQAHSTFHCRNYNYWISLRLFLMRELCTAEGPLSAHTTLNWVVSPVIAGVWSLGKVDLVAMEL